MPFTGWAFDAVFISVIIPSYQNPSRSDLSIMEDFVLWAGPKGLAGASPEHVQEPAKYVIFDIAEAGLGADWARVAEATSRRAAAETRVVFIDSSLPSKRRHSSVRTGRPRGFASRIFAQTSRRQSVSPRVFGCGGR